jgi:hypothetical protein
VRLPGWLAAPVAVAFPLTGLQILHSIRDPLVTLGALLTGDAPFGYLDWRGRFTYTAVGNVAGGPAFVRLPRVLRSKDRQEARAAVDAA